MYPELFRIPYIDYPISSFGVMLATAFLAGLWLTSRQMVEKGLDPEKGQTMLLYVMVGGVLGSKLYFAFDNWLLGNGTLTSLLFAGPGIGCAGLTFYGGLIGGTLGAAIGCRIHDLDLRTFANCVAPALAVGQAIGRIGCFLVGDDYGRKTDVAWGVAFPQGSPPTFDAVHPTQLYEFAWLLPVAAFLWSRRKKSPFLIGEYLVLNGAGRIVIESWRVNPRVALGLSEPQLIGIGLVILGVAGWLYYANRGARPSLASSA